MESRGWHHRRSLLSAVVAALALAGAASPAAAQCGQDYHQAPAHSDIPGGPPLAIGDSVLADAVPLLARDGFEADGMVCRRMDQGLALLEERGTDLPHLVVLALGTNGYVTPAEIDTALTILGPSRVLVLVTPYGSVVRSTPQVIRAAAASHPGRILLLDWERIAADHRNWLAPDGVHLGGPEGIEAYADMIASVLPYASPPPPEPAARAVEPPVRHRARSTQRHHPERPPPPRTVTSQVPQPPVRAASPKQPTPSVPRPVRDLAAVRTGPSTAVLVALGILAAAILAVAATIWRLKRR